MISIIRFAGLVFIFLTLLGLIVPCHASDINIVGTVTPTSGKEDTNFTYSAVINNIGSNYDLIGALKIELIVSDNRVNKSFSERGKFQGNGLSPEELIRGRSDPYIFSFNPDRQGLKNIDELSYEFVLTTGSGKELARNKYPGPKIVIPPEFQSLQYSRVPYYYFQEFPITLTFIDKPNVIPSLQLFIRGPLNSSEETKWTEDLAARAAGTTHTFSRAIDLSHFPEGGNFSFNFTYNDFREKEGYEPITGGPYYFTILPYLPKIAEPVGLAEQIEYNNFSLRVSVEDEGAVLVGDHAGSSASLIIDHPTKGEMVINNSGPTLQGKYLVFEWDKNSVQFEKRDVLQSKKEPLRAHLRYWNENRDYGANSSNYTFTLVNATPLLAVTHEPVLYMTCSETARESIRAYVTYARGMGDLLIGVTGPDGYYENALKGSPAGVNKYQYDWSRMFNSSQAGNYTLSFTYLHDTLEGGRYEFERKPEYSFQVVPIFIEFQNGNVSPSRGMWNGSYSYTIEANSSVEADAILQIFNPCSSEWVDAGGARKIKAGASNISWVIQPFAYECDELDSGKYRFRANYQGRDFSLTRVYAGPLIEGRDITLVSLDYQPVLYVSKDRSAYQVVRATVDSLQGRAKVGLIINGPGKSFEEQSDGSFLGGFRYSYSWSIPFTLENKGNHTISLRYIHPEKEVSFPEQTMSVVEEENMQPQLLSFDYSPIIYLEGDRGDKGDRVSWQNITAEVFSPRGEGVLRLGILGPDRNKTESIAGEDKGENVYLYRWSQPFNSSSAGKNYRISASYLLARNSYAFDDRMMSVVHKDDTAPQIWEPTLGLEYDRTIFVPAGGKADQVIRASINYSQQDPGHLRLNFDKDMRVSAFDKGLIKFNNASVTPSHGSGLTKYSYCVDIETELQEADIQLAIAGPNSSILAGQQIVHYNSSKKTLCWPDVLINSNKEGNASFKFLSHATSSQAYPGPRIEAINASGSVQPALGVLQGFRIADEFYYFNYTLHITNMSRDLTPWIELMVRSPNSSWRTVGQKKQYDPSKGPVSWKEKPFANESFFGEPEFRFKVDGLETQTFRGPEIAVIYDEPSWSRTGNKYSYYAWFNATENLTIDLVYSDDGQRWTAANRPQNYAANSGRIKKTWPEQDGHNVFEFDIKIRKEGDMA